MKRLIILPSSIAVIVMYPILLALILAIFIGDNIIMAIDAVAEFIDYHLSDQIEVVKESWNGK
jgi:hypothetical protein